MSVSAAEMRTLAAKARAAAGPARSGHFMMAAPRIKEAATQGKNEIYYGTGFRIDGAGEEVDDELRSRAKEFEEELAAAGFLVQTRDYGFCAPEDADRVYHDDRELWVSYKISW